MFRVPPWVTSISTDLLGLAVKVYGPLHVSVTASTRPRYPGCLLTPRPGPSTTSAPRKTPSGWYRVAPFQTTIEEVRCHTCLVSQLDAPETDFVLGRGLAHLIGEELYNNLIRYLREHLAQLTEQSKKHTDEALLSFYIREWKRYTTAAKYINHLFSYLNRHWVKREVDEGKKSIYDVYTLHLVRWKLDLFTHVQESVMASVLKLVEKQRNGETVEQTQIKSIVDSFGTTALDSPMIGSNADEASLVGLGRLGFEKVDARCIQIPLRAALPRGDDQVLSSRVEEVPCRKQRRRLYGKGALYCRYADESRQQPLGG